MRKKLNAIVALLCATVLVLSLTACAFGTTGTQSGNKGSGTQDVTEDESTQGDSGTKEVTEDESTQGGSGTKEVTEDESAQGGGTQGENEGNNDGEKKSSIVISDGYLYYGSYPQREVVSQKSDSGVSGKAWETEDDCIINATLYATLQGLSEDKWSESGDATVDGNKYRRIKASDATKSTSDDANQYEWASSEAYHYFQYEPIKWRVLEQNGSDVFVMSEVALDAQMYNSIITNMTWETSTIRSWLNGYDGSQNLYGTDYSGNNFINTAFSSEEQAKIKTTTLENKDNSKNGTEGGNDTNDKIYLLSEDEVYGDQGSGYGFASDYDVDDVARQAKSSTYAKAMGTYVETESGSVGNCWWWLRTPGTYTGLYILVRCSGSVYRGGQHANSKTRGVRPAMYLTIE